MDTVARNILEAAENLKCRSCSIPPISTGIFYSRSSGITLHEVYLSLVNGLIKRCELLGSLRVIRLVGAEQSYKGFITALKGITEQ